VSHWQVKYKQKRKKILCAFCSPSSESVQLKREQDIVKMFCSRIETDIVPARKLNATFASIGTVWTASYDA